MPYSPPLGRSIRAKRGGGGSPPPTRQALPQRGPDTPDRAAPINRRPPFTPPHQREGPPRSSAVTEGVSTFRAHRPHGGTVGRARLLLSAVSCRLSARPQPAVHKTPSPPPP